MTQKNLISQGKTVNLLKVIEAVQWPVSLNKCLLTVDACKRKPNCPVSDKLAQLQKHIEGFLRGMSRFIRPIYSPQPVFHQKGKVIYIYDPVTGRWGDISRGVTG